MATKDKTAGQVPDAEGEPAPDVAPVEVWREVRAPEAWAHEAARQLRNWPIGQVVSLSDYDAAIKAAQAIEVS